MTRVQNHYEVLQISTAATDVEIRKAYHNLAKQHHPDKSVALDTLPSSVTQATSVFLDLQIAFNILKTPDLRQQYDRQLASGRIELALCDVVDLEDMQYEMKDGGW
eukprot:CAMPEP_0196579948 /NCGR_PEP_ID=MMETSP1081-20130531/25902_1 /TAXON_ID=36882 /ORGANISM="Pyramimonas amylifera, Strain CCMP720" /LENGTH=105 /DNA_ID=CAMNT_0041899681 /DNA_START=30 /DNA_END=344 /DNA_ORIENTATION=-